MQLRLLEVHLRQKLINSCLFMLGDQGNHNLHEFLQLLHNRCMDHDGRTNCAPGATRLSGRVPLGVFENFVQMSHEHMPGFDRTA